MADTLYTTPVAPVEAGDTLSVEMSTSALESDTTSVAMPALRYDTVQLDTTSAVSDTTNARWHDKPSISSTAYPLEEDTVDVSSETLYIAKPIDDTQMGDTVFSLFNPQSFLKKDTIQLTGTVIVRRGVEGKLLPYNVSSDNVVTSLLIICLLITIICLSHSRRFIARQAKSFVYTPHGLTSTITETGNEIAAQLFLALQTCLLLSIVGFIYIQHNVHATFVLPSLYTLIWILFAAFIAYYIVKTLLYQMVNAVFFEKKKKEQFIKAFLFITAIEGVVLFPVILLQVYFDVTIEKTVIATLSVILIAKLLTLYRSFSLFFKRPGGWLQIILYFCALEITPPLFLWGIMAMVIGSLRIDV